eukprot:108055-Chlamydomonas_euryale.AAC.1
MKGGRGREGHLSALDPMLRCQQPRLTSQPFTPDASNRGSPPSPYTRDASNRGSPPSPKPQMPATEGPTPTLSLCVLTAAKA